MLIKILSFTLKCAVVAGVIALAACRSDTAAAPEAEAGEPVADAVDAPVPDTDMLQLLPVQPGEELAVLHTSMGDIKLRFFPSEAPKAVENFITHAKNGYYDGLIFHRVIQGFMVQGGDPLGTGTGGESIWGAGFGPEFSLKVRHFRGALSMAQSQQPNSIGSQFFIVQNQDLAALDPGYVEEFERLKTMQDEQVASDEAGNPVYLRDVMPTEALDQYINYGGTPHLDLAMSERGHTVFGHVVAGMDVVDAIAAVPTGANDKPLTDVVIDSISFETQP